MLAVRTNERRGDTLPYPPAPGILSLDLDLMLLRGPTEWSEIRRPRHHVRAREARQAEAWGRFFDVAQ